MASSFLFFAICLLVLYIFVRVFRLNENFSPYFRPINTSRGPVTMFGTNPIRQRQRYFPTYYGYPRVWEGSTTHWDPYYQMYTSSYADVCSRYGSSTMDVDPSTYYTGSGWCPVGIVFSSDTHPSVTYSLEARFIGNSWSFRVRDAISEVFFYLNTVGSGPYGAYRDGEPIQIPGKTGKWTVQVQTQYTPYLLSV